MQEIADKYNQLLNVEQKNASDQACIREKIENVEKFLV